MRSNYHLKFDVWYNYTNADGVWAVVCSNGRHLDHVIVHSDDVII